MSQKDHWLSGLKARRTALNVSPAELAKAIGVTTVSYYRFENGARPITLNKAVTLAHRLATTVDNLLTTSPEDERPIVKAATYITGSADDIVAALDAVEIPEDISGYGSVVPEGWNVD
jgi:transcriptional regulator with XRE-family HTH domain